jgi:hypothetical protein
VTNRPSQIEQCSKRVEKDRLDHSSQTFHSEEIASKRPNQLRHARAGQALNSDREEASKTGRVLEQESQLSEAVPTWTMCAIIQ